MNAEKRVAELKLELPPPPAPAGTYSPVVQIGDKCYLSGHIPIRPDGSLIEGKVGADLTVSEGNEAAYATGLAILSSLRDHLGSLNRVKRIIKVLGVVNATADFCQHPQVINGFSDLMVEVFGDAGRAARSAVGASSLPLNIPVELEAIVQVAE